MTGWRRYLGRLAALALLVGGCGGSSAHKPAPTPQQAAIADAMRPRPSDFPPALGRSLRDIGATLNGGASLGLATSVYTPGRDRLAFALIDQRARLVCGRTAIYLAAGGLDGKASGPYLAPADPLSVPPWARSKNAAADTADVTAIYETQVPFPRPGRYTILAATRQRVGITGAATTIDVARRSSIPAVGGMSPRVDTDTVFSANGNLAAIDTRRPHDDMHTLDFREVLGRRPVALLFSTPELCQSRVCGPVTDIAVALQRRFGSRISFIHQEVYVGNDVRKGLRPPLRAFGLTTEPWLFTFDRRGLVAARLEGAFGTNAFREALEAALR